MTAPTHFTLRYGRLRPLFSVMGLGPHFARIELDDNALHVRLGWAFSVSLPRANVAAAKREPKRYLWSIGAHLIGPKTWLVNGSAYNIVFIDIDPMVRGYALGIPVRLRRLGISLDEPDELVAALTGDD